MSELILYSSDDGQTRLQLRAKLLQHGVRRWAFYTLNESL
jgi:hypothetical protein